MRGCYRRPVFVAAVWVDGEVGIGRPKKVPRTRHGMRAVPTGILRVGALHDKPVRSRRLPLHGEALALVSLATVREPVEGWLRAASMTCTSYAESRRSRRGSVRTRPTISARCFLPPTRADSQLLIDTRFLDGRCAGQRGSRLLRAGARRCRDGGRSFVTIVVADQGQWRIRVMLQCAGPYADAQCPGGHSKTEARRTVSASRRRAV
jgi:hypothetical protein